MAPLRPISFLLALAAVGLAGCRGGSRSGRFDLRRDPVERFDPNAPWVPPLSAIPVASARPTVPPAAPPSTPSTAPSRPAAAPSEPARTAPAAPAVPLAAAPVEGSTPIFVENREVGRLTPADFAEFNRIWALFVAKDKAWPAGRDAWIARGGAAPFVLSENLFRYFLSATAYGQRADIYRVAENARAAGEPAVGYFGNLLIRDTWPLHRPIVVKQADGTSREVREWTNDDITRQHLTIILAAIGEPSVPRLTTEPYIHAAIPSARHYVLAALGRIGTDAAVAAAAQTLATSADWQDRGYAAKALGFALNFKKNLKARAPLERALSDPDEFVRKKAKEGLDGKTKSEF